MGLPVREKLPHTIPQWVAKGSWFFITINCVLPGKNQLCLTPGAHSPRRASCMTRYLPTAYMARLFLVFRKSLDTLVRHP